MNFTAHPNRLPKFPLRQLIHLICFLASVQNSYSIDVTPYAWEFPKSTNISTAATPLKFELEEEIQKVVNSGLLAPLYISYADQASVGYTVYQEPGRILTTLAWAYPHLSPTLQANVLSYVQTLLSDPNHAPWASYPLPKNAGTPRELHPKTKWWYENPSFGLARPSVHTLYGVWLWAYRANDWDNIQPYWDAIKTTYLNKLNEADLYGTMCAHIAMARLAYKFNDSMMLSAAMNALTTSLNNSLDFNLVEERAWNKTPYWISPYREMYDPAMDGTTYRGWVFLNLSPEMGRYLRDHVLTATLTRHSQGKVVFPKWWLGKANYFCRSWTGDEGTGLVPEVFGMMAPIERWVVNASAETLAEFMRSSPTGIGDCYWLEGLVQAIEAHGTTQWVDVRTSTFISNWREYE
ncbi:MAG: hypothetical protein D6691_11070 [Candidatus Hydrogenedentota bacterium]|jgi:hypothetical protein|uniref:Uncharacterized protein n=1 Tax=Sumerlaea chitinivorans TaxID=2250252 RepID=A0A2Z4Y7X8_SUMC1|nr:hypothetical protein BRCON_2161 [Candidatus Sumerlaea chitinivorans]MCX7964527.1 hypothetical protein [Candidatus Sumerlaea chitinivorans]RMH24757.1 MAG: hypothetical protein D6691_11070 [Candidatus Hydrogenedentota bacterium]